MLIKSSPISIQFQGDFIIFAGQFEAN